MADQGRFPIEAFEKELALKRFEFLLTLYGIVGPNDETPVEIDVVCTRMGVNDIRFQEHAVANLRTDRLIVWDGLVRITNKGSEMVLEALQYPTRATECFPPVGEIYTAAFCWPAENDMADSDYSEAVQNALDLEREQILQLMDEEGPKIEVETMQAIEQFAISGNLFGTPARERLLEIEIRALKNLVSNIVDNRRELASKVPDLAKPELVAELEVKVETMIETRFKGLAERIVKRTGGYGIGGNHELDDERLQTLAWAKRELRIAIHRAGVDRQAVRTIPTSVHFHQSAVNLNLGTIIGDVKASVKNLQSQGAGELADALTELTEAVAKAERELGDTRAEILEQLKYVAQQASAPSDERNRSVVMTVLTTLGSRLRDIQAIAKAWEWVEQLATEFFK